MKSISDVKQATLRALFIFLSMPAVTWAGVKIDNTLDIDTTLILKIASLLVASFWGGVSSALIPTSFDQNMPSPKFTKIWIGTALGLIVGLTMLMHFNFGLFASLLPSFIVGSLGAPIMVFYLMWLSNPETQAEIKEQIKKKVQDKLGVSK